MSGGIFVSYRRDDAKHAAGRLVDRLEKSFSRDQLFFDIDNIEPGFDFVRVLKEQVESCDVLLPIIGPGWLDARDEHGARRLDNPKDFVRIELETALARDIRVIPVLVDGAKMPGEGLPSALRGLATRHAVRLEHTRFSVDADGLLAALRRTIGFGVQEQSSSNNGELRGKHNLATGASGHSGGRTGDDIVLSEVKLKQLGLQVENRRIYVAPDIPHAKVINARRTAAVPVYEVVVVLVDGTWFGSAKNCLAVTTRGIYFHNSNERWSLLYKQLKGMHPIRIGVTIKLGDGFVICFTNLNASIVIGSLLKTLINHLQRSS